jgi:uncharacterized protein GlcG (DUF336 family)
MINLKEARHVIAAAEAKAHKIGQPMNIAVVDTGSNPEFQSWTDHDLRRRSPVAAQWIGHRRHRRHQRQW